MGGQLFLVLFCTQAQELVGMFCSPVSFMGLRFCTPSAKLHPALADIATTEFAFHISTFACRTPQNSGGQLQKYAAPWGFQVQCSVICLVKIEFGSRPLLSLFLFSVCFLPVEATGCRRVDRQFSVQRQLVFEGLVKVLRKILSFQCFCGDLSFLISVCI